MSKEPNNIDHLVREKLGGFEMTPPPSVWENTSASLKAGRKKRFFFWFALGLAALAILGTGVYFFSSGNTVNEQLVAGNRTNQTNKTTKDIAEAENKARSNSDKSTSAKNNLTSADGQNINDENSTNSDNDISSGEYNNRRNSSGGDLTMSQKNTKASGDRNDSSSQSQKDRSSKQTGSGNNSSVSDDQNDFNPKQALPFGDNTDNSNSLGKNNSILSDQLQEGQEFEIGPLNTSSRTLLEEYNSLATNPAKLLQTNNPTPLLIPYEEGSILYKPYKHRAFSLEGSIGASTFTNKPDAQTTGSQLDSILSKAPSNRKSLDLRFGVNYHFSNRVSFQTGIHYNSASEDYQFKSTETVTYSYIDTISMSVDSTLMDTTYVTNTVFYDTITTVSKNERNSYKVFTLPFQMAWNQPISKRAALEFVFGGELSIYGKNVGSTIVDANNSIAASEAYHTSGMLSLGGSIKYVYHIGDRHAVYVEPWLQFGITNQFTPQLNYTSLRRRGGLRFGYRIYL